MLMKSSTGTLRGNNDITEKEGWFYSWRPLTFSPSILSDCFLVILGLVWVGVTTGSTRRYLDPAEVDQLVQLVQDDTLKCAIGRRFAVSPSIVSRAWRKQAVTLRELDRAVHCP